MADPICIQCGHSTRGTDRLNRLADGKVCPACRERLLAELPPALPAAPASEPERSPAKARVRRPRRAKREGA